MQIYLNEEEFDIGYEALDTSKLNMKFIVDYMSGCYSQQVITAVEIDGDEYYPGEIPYEDIPEFDSPR